MKRPNIAFILVIALTLIIISVSLYSQHMLSATSSQLNTKLSEIEKGISNSDWETASSASEALERNWSSVNALWASLIDHQEIDNIDETLSKLKMYIRAEDTASALAEVSALANYIDHIPQKEALLIKNIL
jgi:hypothetical protein